MFGVCLSVSDFLAVSLETNKNQQKKMTHFTIQFRSEISLILRTLTHSALRKVYSHNTAKNFTNFRANMFLFSVRKYIFTAQFLDAQELHSRSTWKVNSYIPEYLRKKIFVTETQEAFICWGLNNFLKTTRCLGLLKCFKIFHFS